MPTNTDAAEERHLARLCYLLGYAIRRLHAEAHLRWELADVGDPLPSAVLKAFDLIEGCASGLDAAPQPQKRKRKAACGEVVRIAKQVVADLGRCWGSPEHEEFILVREQVEGELDAHELVRGASHHAVPVAREQWVGLFGSVGGCLAGLPERDVRWAELGDAVAALLPGGRVPSWRGVALKVAALHATLAATPWVAPAPDLYGGGEGGDAHWPPPSWATGEAARFHAETLDRLAGQTTSPFAGALPPGVSKETLAIALLVEHPGITVDEVAATVGCDRATLYRSETFKRTRRVIRSSQRRGLRKGAYRRGRGGELELEAIDGGDD